jgi:hypothetical protein
MIRTCQWVGTDALVLTERPPANKLWYLKQILYRLKWKFAHDRFDNHYIVHERLRKHLIEFGINPSKISVKIDPPIYKKKFKKQKHKGFNVLYYHPRPIHCSGEKYIRWKYGIDFIEEIIEYFSDFKEINFIKIDGSQDLSKIFPVTDFYLRPSRHDGLPRINLECEINKIPYYYREDGKPNINDIKKCIEKLKEKCF